MIRKNIKIFEIIGVEELRVMDRLCFQFNIKIL